MTASVLLTLPARLAEGAVRAYQLLLAPVLGTNCRFYPSCSAYSREAFRRHGFVRGLGLTLWRLARCNPWNAGGLDPVPDHVCRHHHAHPTPPGTAQATQE